MSSSSDSPSGSIVQRTADGAVRVPGDATLASLAADPLVGALFPVLAHAARRAPASTALSLADDLSRRGFCPYLVANAPCLKNGGDRCLAVDGDNRLLSMLEGGPSWIVHPSDAGVALVALEATIEVAGPRGARTVDAADFYVLPTARLDRETVLTDDERIVSVLLPSASAGGVQRFTDERDAETGVAQVSLAAVRRADGEVRLVLGAVSPRPYRVYNSIEEETTSGGLDEDTIEGLAERALLDAEPLSMNGYKVEIAARLLRDAIRELSAE